MKIGDVRIGEPKIRELKGDQGEPHGRVNCDNNDIYIYPSADFPERFKGVWMSLDQYFAVVYAETKANYDKAFADSVMEPGKLMVKGMIAEACDG